MKLFESLWRKKTARHRPMFEPDLCTITREARLWLSNDDIEHAVARHLQGDWGEVSEEASDANELALIRRGQLHSVYVTEGGIEIEVNTQLPLTETVVDVTKSPMEEILDDMLDEDLCH